MSLRKLPSLSIPEPPGLSHPGARGCHCCGQSPLAGQLQWPCCTPHSPLPSHTQFPHRFQPRVSDVLFGTAIYSWHRNTNTARGGIPQKTPRLCPHSECHSVPAQCSAPVHPPGWQAPLCISFVLLSQLLLCLCPFTLPHPLCYSKAQHFSVGSSTSAAQSAFQTHWDRIYSPQHHSGLFCDASVST